MKILIVDDEAPIRNLLKQILESQAHDCLTAKDAEEAAHIVEENDIDLLLSDINMPGKSGLDFVRDVLPANPTLAVIMVTAVVDHMLAESLLKLGVYDYITKPIDKTRVLISVANALNRLELQIANLAYRESLEEMVQDRTEALEQTLGKMKHMVDGIVHAIAHIVETRDPYTAGHQRRVADLARAVAGKLGLSDRQIQGVHIAGLIHDVGKITVPSEILSKPTRLSNIEFSLIKTHSEVGYNILKSIEFPWPIAQSVYQHHERIDGSGYPQHLKKEDILIEARILAVCDVVEAMASHRPYRAGLGIDTALAEIRKNAGIFYDHEVAKACEELFTQDHYQLESITAF